MLTQITKQLKQFQIFLAIHLCFIQMLVYAPNKKRYTTGLYRNYGSALYFIAIKNIVNLWTVHYTLVTINLMVCAYKSLSFRYKDFRMKKQDRMDVIMHLNDKSLLQNEIILNFLCFFVFVNFCRHFLCCSLVNVTFPLQIL